MLVAYPLPGNGYRYPIRRGSGLFISLIGVWRCLLEDKQEIIPRFFRIITKTSNQEWRRHITKQMERILKYLMLLLVTTFSLTLTACGGGNDDEPKEPDDISMVGQLNTVAVKMESFGVGHKVSAPVTVDVGCNVHLEFGGYWGNRLWISGGEITYAGDFNQLSSITTAPLMGYEKGSTDWINGGCYIIHSNTGVYIRLKVELNDDESSVTFKFQNYQPSNIF